MIKNGFIFINDENGVARFSIRVEDVLCVFHRENVYNPGAKGCRIQYVNRVTKRIEEVEFEEITVDDFMRAMTNHYTSEPFSYDAYFVGSSKAPPSFWPL